jgi:hypothetical protein
VFSMASHIYRVHRVPSHRAAQRYTVPTQDPSAAHQHRCAKTDAPLGMTILNNRSRGRALHTGMTAFGCAELRGLGATLAHLKGARSNSHKFSVGLCLDTMSKAAAVVPGVYFPQISAKPQKSPFSIGKTCTPIPAGSPPPPGRSMWCCPAPAAVLFR